MYRGVRYRSRLEARWARLFDWAGWRYDYEPVDLDGWIPDFAVDLPDPAGPALVECKPAIKPSDFAPAQSKAEASGASGTVVVLGARWSREPGVWAVLPGEGREGAWRAWAIPARDPAHFERLSLGWTAAGNAVQWKRR